MADRTVSVKLRADVAQYMRNMRTAGRATSELEKASKQLQIAFDNEEDAAGRVRVAETQLADAQKSSRTTATQLAKAQEALANAQRKYARSQEDTIVATQRYETVQQSVDDTMGDTVEAFDSASRDIDKIAKRTQLSFRVMAGAIAAAAPAVGAAAIGAAATAAGAAFIGLGAVALRESERVTDAWSQLGTDLQAGLAHDASVLEQPFIDAAANIGGAFQDMRPQLREAFADSVPYVDMLTDGVIDLTQNAMPGVTRSVAEAGPAVQGFANLLADAGTGLSGFFDQVAEHSASAGLGISHLGDLVAGTLPAIGGILGNLSDLWAEHGDVAVDVINQLMSTLEGLTGGALPAFGSTLGAALQVLSSVLAVIEPISGVLGAGIGVWLSYAAAMRAVTAVSGAVGALTTRVRGLGDASTGLSRGGMVAGAALAGMGAAAHVALGQVGEFNVTATKLSEGMEKFAATGKASGEAARLFGEDMSGLGEAMNLVTQSGIGKWSREFSEGLANLFGAQGELGDAKEQIESLDAYLANLAQTDAPAALSLLQKSASAAGVSTSELRAQLPQFREALDQAGVSGANLSANTAALNAQVSRSSAEYERASTELQEYMDKQRAATDPVFAMNQAVRQVGEAQKAYNQAVTQYGAKSPQASEAAWTLAEAVSGAEQAALNGDLSFSNFRGKLQQWVAQGVLTQQQADSLAGRVKNLRGEANNYRGDYAATLHANTRQAADNLSSVQSQLNSLDGQVATSYHNLMRTVTTTTGTGSNTGLYNFDWNSKGGKISGYAGGGRITGPGTGTSDSILGFAEGTPIRVSNGEYISTAASTARNESALAAGNRGATLVAVNGATGGGGGRMVMGAPQAAPVTHVSASFHFPNYVGNRSELMTVLRKEIRTVHGGNINRAFGGKGAA